MKVYIVTTADCEGHSMMNLSVHSTRDGAMKQWNVLRLRLLAEAIDMANDPEGFPEMYARMVAALAETDPEQMNNYPHDCPVVFEREMDGAQ